jgi:hypothetical protein
MVYRLIFIFSFFAFVLLSGIFYFFYLLIRNHRQWKEKVRNDLPNRISKRKQDFIDFYINMGYQEESIDFVYNNTQEFLRAKDLILLHTDDIVNLYQREEEEWIFILNRWLKGLGYVEISVSLLREKHSNSLDFEFLIRTIQLKGMI